MASVSANTEKVKLLGLATKVPSLVKKILDNDPIGKSIGNGYLVIVDYDKSVEKMVKLGHYDWFYEDLSFIKQKFPHPKQTNRVKVIIELIEIDFSSLDRSNSKTDYALEEFNRLGYRPSDHYELLAFGAKYPKVQCEFVVVALGSEAMWPDGSEGETFLDYSIGSGRCFWAGTSFCSSKKPVRFAAVRK